MVLKNKLTELVLNEVQTSISGNENISSDEVYLQGEEIDVARPRIVYDTFGEKMDYNDGSNGVWAYAKDDQGNKIAEVDREYITLTFDFQILSTDQNICDSIYEDVRQRFLQYERRLREPEDIHSEVEHVYVSVDSRDPNYGLEPTQRFSRCPVDVEFYRKVTLDGEPIEKVFHEIENINYETT